MRRLFALTLFFLIAVRLGPSGAASDTMSEPSWRLFKYEPGRFSVEMPGEPQRINTRTKSFIGTITTHVFLTRNRHEEYTVSYSDLPGFAVTFAGSGTIYSNAKGALLMEPLGKEQQFEDAALNGTQGKYLVYDMPDPQTKVDMRGAAYRPPGCWAVWESHGIVSSVRAVQHHPAEGHRVILPLCIETPTI